MTVSLAMATAGIGLAVRDSWWLLAVSALLALSGLVQSLVISRQSSETIYLRRTVSVRPSLEADPLDTLRGLDSLILRGDGGVEDHGLFRFG